MFLVPANACPVVPLAILSAGREVEFIDIDPDLLSINDAFLRKRLCDTVGLPVAGIVFIRPYGAISPAAVNFSQLKALSASTLIIDDRCASLPETSAVELAQSGADVYLYSTGYGKYADLGFGGYAFMNSSLEYEAGLTKQAEYIEGQYRLLETRWKRFLSSEHCNPPNAILRGTAGWLNKAQLDIEQTEYLERISQRKASIAKHKSLADQIYRTYIPPDAFVGHQYNDWRHQIFVDGKQSLLDLIFSNKLFASGHYDTTARIFSQSHFPQSDQLYSRVVNLFNDYHITEPQMIDVAKLVSLHLSQC